MATKSTKKPAKKEKGLVPFLISVLMSFIVALVWLVIGSSYASVSHSPKMDALFPVDPDSPPYAKPAVSGEHSPLDLFKPNKYSAPYSLCPDNEDCSGFGGSFKEWFQKSIEFSYVNGRKGMQGFLKTTSAVDDALGKKNTLNTTFSVLFGPLFISILIGLSHLFGTISNLIGQFNQGHWVWGIAMLLVGLGPALASGIGSMQSLQTLFTFIGWGAYQSGSLYKEILASHKNLFVGIFGLLVVLSAFDNLSVWGGISAAIVYAGVLFGFL
ncbi:MAG: hypothetical protein CL669_04280 [Balneola sp.]|nr:hypothetical protein [Balneola sp.]